MKGSRASNYSLIGKTEIIKNNLNPDFVNTFFIDYFFEKEQWIKFVVFDVDANSSDLIGEVEITLSRIMTTHNQSWDGDLKINGQGASRGKIIVRADSVSDSNDEIQFSLSATITSG